MLRGVLVTLSRRCGRPNGHCARGEPHQSPALACPEQGRTRTLTLTAAAVPEVRRALARYQAMAVRRGQARQVAGALRRGAARRGLASARGEGAGTCATDLHQRPDLGYPQALQAGWPIASGVIRAPAATGSGIASI